MKPRILELPLALKLSSAQEDKLGRRRYQAPLPEKKGNFWTIRIREDALDEEGKKSRTRPRYVLGPCVGPGALSLREAKKLAADNVLKTINNYSSCPSSVITFEAFIAQKFLPEYVELLKHAGKEHYKYCIKKMLPYLGSLRLRDIQPSDVRKMVSKMEQKPYSQKTISHVKTAVVTIINFAKEEKYFSGDNPGERVRLPEVHVPERLAYSFAQAQAVIEALPSPVREMVFLSMTTSLNVAELCGLRRMRLNLTDSAIFSAGEAIPPYSALVRENYYRNRWGTVKSKKRRRTVGLPDFVVETLQQLLAAAKFDKPNDPVFTSRNGTPIDAHNTNSRIFKKVSAQLGIPVTWHIFRHSAATFMNAMDMPLADREKMMGHANADMTMHYTHADVERRRKYQNQITERLIPEKERLMKQLINLKTDGPRQ
jgi:integrase